MPPKPTTKKSKPHGGFAFFLSLAVLGFLLPIQLVALSTLFSFGAVARLIACGLGSIVGALLASFLIRGGVATFLHEFKHSLVSGLVGNRFKKMQVNRDAGAFEYTYTKDTAHFNAFISIAPYCVPLCTLAVGVLWLFWWHPRGIVACVVVGLGYGMDLSLNLRDVGPHQTDLTGLRGGFPIGIAYVTLANLVIAATLAAWVLQGSEGLKMLLIALVEVVSRIMGR